MYAYNEYLVIFMLTRYQNASYSVCRCLNSIVAQLTKFEICFYRIQGLHCLRFLFLFCRRTEYLIQKCKFFKFSSIYDF